MSGSSLTPFFFFSFTLTLFFDSVSSVPILSFFPSILPFFVPSHSSRYSLSFLLNFLPPFFLPLSPSFLPSLLLLHLLFPSSSRQFSSLFFYSFILSLRFPPPIPRPRPSPRPCFPSTTLTTRTNVVGKFHCSNWKVCFFPYLPSIQLLQTVMVEIQYYIFNVLPFPKLQQSWVIASWEVAVKIPPSY